MTTAEEREDVWDWVSQIAPDVMKGAATGAVAGPWGAVIGGLAGGAGGAIRSMSQPPKGAPAPPSPQHITTSGPPQPASAPAATGAAPFPPQNTAAPPSLAPPVAASASDVVARVAQQLSLLLPLLTELRTRQAGAVTSSGAPHAEEVTCACDDAAAWAAEEVVVDWSADDLDDSSSAIWDRTEATPLPSDDLGWSTESAAVLPYSCHWD